MPIVKAATPAQLSYMFNTYETIFNKQYQSYDPIYNKFAMTVQSNSDVVVYPFLDALVGMREWVGPRYHQDMKAIGYALTNQEWELTIDFKRKDIDDDNLGLYEIRTLQAANSTAARPDQEFLSLLTNGFTNTCYDGTAFFSTAGHTWKGGSYINGFSLDLSEANYQTVLEQLLLQVGSFGANNEAPLMASNLQLLLVHGPKTRAEALKITKADYGQFGATNINAGSAEDLLWPGITDKSWFLFITNNAVKPFVFQDRVPLQVTNVTDPGAPYVAEHNAYPMYAYRRFTTGYGLWQLACGSQPG